MKKRILSLLLALTLVCGLLPALPTGLITRAEAAEEYDLYVAGVKVTAANCWDILGNGAFSYDPDENRLTVMGDCELSDSNSVINNHIEGLTIYAARKATLIAAHASAICSSRSVTITGPGLLQVKSDHYFGIYVTGGATLTMDHASVYLSGGEYGIVGNGHGEALLIDQSFIRSWGENGAICDFDSGIIIRNCDITYPPAASNVNGTIMNQSIKADVVYVGDLYDVWVAGIRVTFGNKDDVLDDGVFQYIPDQQKLSVRGSFDAGYYDRGSTQVQAIWSELPQLTLYVAEDSVLATTADTIYCEGERLTVTGPGRLQISSEEGVGIALSEDHAALELDHAWVDVIGEGGICASGSGNKLSLDRSHLYARTTGGDAAAERVIEGFDGGVTLLDAVVARPAGGDFAANGDFNAREVTIEAQFDLWINGGKVHTGNADDVLGNGIFTYDWAENRLTLNGGTFYDLEDGLTQSVIVETYMDGLTIYVAADTTLRSNRYDAIYVGRDCAITGPGKLTVRTDDQENRGRSGIELGVGGCELTIRDADVSAYGGAFGISGNSSASDALVIENSLVYAVGGGAAIWNLEGGISIYRTSIIQPVNAINSGVSIYEANGSTPAKTVSIEPSYLLWIAGEQVTGRNAVDVLGDGCFSYNPSLNLLTVKGDCQLTEDDKVSVIHNRIPDLIIWIERDVTLSSPKRSVITIDRDCTITGPGRLTARSAECSGVELFDKCTLTLERANLNFQGIHGIYGSYDPSLPQKLIVRSSGVRAEGWLGNTAVYGVMGGIVLEDCAILTPSGGAVSGGNIVDGHGGLAALVEIGAFYDLSLDGVRVTSLNANDVLGHGEFAFDPATSTLTVKGDCAAASTNVLINNGIPGLTVYVPEDARLCASTFTLKSDADLTITGPGKLTLESSYDFGCGAYVTNGAALSVIDANLEARGAWGLSGNHTGETLLIQRSVVQAEGSAANGAISDFRVVALRRSPIVKPEGAYVGANGILNAEGAPAPAVTIGAYDLWLAGTRVTYLNRNDILGDGGFSYSRAKNRLTVRGGVTSSAGPILLNGISGLTVFVTENPGGSWSMRAIGHPAIQSDADLTITGPGRLNLGSTGGSGRAVDLSMGATLTVRDADLNIDNSPYGIGGNLSGEYLVVRNSTVSVTTQSGAVFDLDGIDLDACRLVLPEKGYVYGGEIENQNGSLANTVKLEPVNPFTDVKANKYYYKPVLWAYYHIPQIASGTSGTTFSPNATCTREQIVTYLWHAMNDPEPVSTDNPFIDVKKKHYFYHAVLWAVENGVTSGVDETTFGVGQPCTRAQAMTFLWNALGKPEPKTAVSPFTDVTPKKYFYKAVLWAVENGITSGVGGGKFGASDTCTRGQIVTFLYKAIMLYL